MLKVNNKDTRKTPLALTLYIFHTLFCFFVNFEQVHVGWLRPETFEGFITRYEKDFPGI